MLVVALAFLLLGYAGEPLAALLHIERAQGTINAKVLLLNESFIFIAVLVTTAIAAWLERRSILSYGLPVASAFRGKYWEGVVLGVVVAALVGVAMYAMGAFVITGFALRGLDWVLQPTLWAVAMLLVGFTEESWFRGYPLRALARGIGFWPAGVISSLIFGALHLTKSHENFIDIFNIVLIGLIMCFALQRTGDLWLPVGFHAAFDFMQFFVIGSHNGGVRPVGTLLQASFPGPAWLNGGPLGTEASCFMLPAMALMIVYIHYRYPNAQL